MRDLTMCGAFRAMFFVAIICATAHASPGRGDSLTALRSDWRQVSSRYRLASARRSERVRILKRGVDSGQKDALEWVVSITRSSLDADLQVQMLDYLAKHRRDSAPVIYLFREFMVRGHVHRARARTFLLAWATRVGRESWLTRLFDQGSTEDRFIVVEALGRIGSKETLVRARKLLDDATWQPKPRAVVCMSTLAQSVARFEGEDSARFLILVRKDPRFLPSDDDAVRRVTRLWKHADPRRYIQVRSLADTDPARRADLARFFGIARYENARAPLLSLATNVSEPIEVRLAAVGALGNLRIARTDLSERLARLLDDHDLRVRRAAVGALAQLRVSEGVKALLPLLGSELDGTVREALAETSGLPAKTDWARWVDSTRCTLPTGT